jgi:Ca2+-transporting ATPase
MGLTTISLLHIVAALEWRNPYSSVLSWDTLANRRFNLLILISLALTFLVTTIGGLQRIFDTVDLSGSQWRACFLAVLGYFILAELGKILIRRFTKARAA